MKKILSYLVIAFTIVSVTGCNSNAKSAEEESPYAGFVYDPEEDEDYVVKIPYIDDGNNTVKLHVTINGMGVDMIYDTGASITTISLQEAQYLAKHGKLDEADILGVENFQIADGSSSQALIINLKQLVIGNKITISNTPASVILNQEAPLLLGGSAFKQFRQVAVDRAEKVIKFYKY
ncbi:MAG: retroviral-like aspartic protease family protein [Coprobacter sp.]|nr:retroviral-like aspartic protease family protein [Coprobacter sp.]